MNDMSPSDILSAASHVGGARAELTTEIVCAYVSRNSIPAAELPGLIRSVFDTVSGLGASAPVAVQAEPLKPACSIKASIQPDYLISLEDGRHFKSLKRHLAAEYGLTPEEYRAKWGLPKDYPMVAPSYAAARSNLAKTMGLGRKAPALAEAV